MREASSSPLTAMDLAAALASMPAPISFWAAAMTCFDPMILAAAMMNEEIPMSPRYPCQFGKCVFNCSTP